MTIIGNSEHPQSQYHHVRLLLCLICVPSYLGKYFDPLNNLFRACREHDSIHNPVKV